MYAILPAREDKINLPVENKKTLQTSFIIEGCPRDGAFGGKCAPAAGKNCHRPANNFPHAGFPGTDGEYHRDTSPQMETDAMNVFDFDNTLLRGDSTARFFAFCLRRYPRMRRDIPAQAVNGLLFAVRLRKKQDFKQRMLHFLALIGDVDAAVDAFWQENMSRIKAWYPPRHRDDDVVISASPEFLIRPACAKLGIECVIGSPVDKYTGHFYGPNCHGQEKVSRFHARFPGAKIEEFYSDSHSDDPLAALAERAYLVKGERLLPW